METSRALLSRMLCCFEARGNSKCNLVTRLVGSAFCQDVLELVGLPLEGDDPVVDDLEPGRLLHRHPRLVVRPLHRRHGLAVVLLEELVKGLLGQPQLALGPVQATLLRADLPLKAKHFTSFHRQRVLRTKKVGFTTSSLVKENKIEIKMVFLGPKLH